MGSLSFICQRRVLLALNIIYMVVGLVLITVPAYSKISLLVTSWPIVGGTIACGVFILLIAMAGLYGTVKHHQIILFFYMFVLVVVFIILFGVSVAALAMSSSQQHTLLQEGWGHLSNETKGELQRLGNCCGFEDKSVTAGPYGHPSCAKLHCSSNCKPCYSYFEEHGKHLRNAVGGTGLFFSFTLFLGVYFAFRFRHLKDPRANPSAFL